LKRLNPGHVGAVLALRGPIERHRRLVGSAAIRAVPAPENGLHSAPAVAARDFNLEAISLSLRASANPQSAISDRVAVVVPLKARTLVVQWRRIVPARGRGDGTLARAAQLTHIVTPS